MESSAAHNGRYAPTPSGPLHLGNLRTALLSWLFSRSAGALHLLRIEDLDPQRTSPEWVEPQLADIAALGIDFDGEPLWQSAREDAYEAAVEQLSADGLVYECWCSRREIREAASAPHGDLPEGAYPGTCLRLTARERAERQRGDRPAALRVRAGAASAGFSDRLHGEVTGTVDDFVVVRNDGTYGYNLAVVLDDAHQGVGEVVRGGDLLSSTARQVWLARELGLEPPSSYAHVPLVLGPDGERLAKRHGAVTLGECRAAGESPAEVRGRLARSLGLAEPGETPSPGELLQRFDADRIPRTDRPLDPPSGDMLDR